MSGMNTVFQLHPEAVAFSHAPDKRAALAQLAGLFAGAYAIEEALVLEALEEREALGSTGFGHGVAIPHARLAGLSRPVAALVRLDAPIAFASADGMPVELLFGLVSPVDCGATHLHALAAVSRLVRDDVNLQRLMDAPGADALYALLADTAGARDAA